MTAVAQSPVEGTDQACAHCGLPVRTPSRARTAAGEASPNAATYCCVGCRMAAAASGGRGAVGFLDARLLVSGVLCMGVMEFTLVLYGDSLFSARADEAAHGIRAMGRIALVFFSLPVLLLLAPPIVRGAWSDLRAGRVRTDGLVILAVAAAWALSAWHSLAGSGEVYFETATMLLLLFAFGRRLEAHARVHGRDAAKALAACLPERAHRVLGAAERSAGQDVEQDVHPDALRAGDEVRVAPGESVPADVVILSGASEVAAAHVTGEEAARPVGAGDEVPAGAVNGPGGLLARVVRPAREGSLGRITTLLDAPLPATRTLRMTDHLSTWLAVAAVAAAGLGAWLAYSRGGVDESVRTALAVLVVACPCALGLATPLAYRAIRAALAKRGVLVRDPAALEVAATATHVFLDKTGTLTDPRAPRLRRVTGAREECERLESLVAHSGHALAAAVRGRCLTPSGVRQHPGAGVEGDVAGVAGRAGSPAWMDRDGLRWRPAAARARSRLDGRGATLVAYAEHGEVVALGAVRQQLRPSAREAVARLRAVGLEVEILSGDRTETAARAGARLGVRARGGLVPEAKVERISEVRAAGGRAIFAGDGVNDAPALRAADVGVAMGCATAAARTQAQVEALGDDLRALPVLVEASRELRRVVRGNLAWNVGYNAVALALAVSGHLHPLVAALGMIASSVTVSVRSYRLLGWQPAERRS